MTDRDIGAVARIVNPVRVGPRRGLVCRGRRLLPQRLVWPLVVVDLSKVVEAPLLGRQAAGGRRCGLFVERAMNPVLRYMKTYGLTHEQLAMVSVVQREWAAKNPRATFRTPITVEDVLNSRMIAYPFRLLQCCLVTDGGGALILVAAERARDFPQKPVYLLGTGESVETPMVSQMEDFTSSRAFRVAGPTVLAEAGITHNDVDHLMIYDAFAHLPIYGLEDLGFVPRGEAGAFIAERNTALGEK